MRLATPVIERCAPDARTGGRFSPGHRRRTTVV